MSPQQPRIVTYLFKSSFYEIKNWTLDFDATTSFNTEYNDCFCLVHMHKGKLSKKNYELTSGNITIERPNFEYQLLPSQGSCTIINFIDDFYQQLQEEFQLDHVFRKQGRDKLSAQAMANAETEYVLSTLLNTIRRSDSSLTDSLVLDSIFELLKLFNSAPHTFPNRSLRKHHHEAIENAKEYLQNNFYKPITLTELSRQCGISLFYLSRLFKQYTGYSPYHYLSTVRLKHSEMLLRNTSSSITDIAYSSGFTSPEYFSTLFKQKYSQTPTKYRTDKTRNPDWLTDNHS